MLKLAISKLLLTLFAVFCFLACAALRPAVRDANRVAAEVLCAQSYSEKMGVSLEEAREVYCVVSDILDPFLAAAAKAKEEAEPVSFGVHAKHVAEKSEK